MYLKESGCTMEKIKNVAIALITLSYVLLIPDMIMNSERYIFKENWLFYVNLVLLCVGFYHFLKYVDKEK